MIRRFENPVENTYWEGRLDDDVLTIAWGTIGTEPETRVVEDSYAEAGVPPEILLDQLAAELTGYLERAPENLLELVEKGHGVELGGRLRRFYAEREHLAHEGRRSRRFDCRLRFASMAVQGMFHQEYYDAKRKTHVTLMPIASKVNDKGYEDEQQWIGVDPRLEDGPVYGLYTSGAFELEFDTLDGFLADLE